MDSKTNVNSLSSREILYCFLAIFLVLAILIITFLQKWSNKNQSPTVVRETEVVTHRRLPDVREDLPTGARHRQARRRMQIERDSDEETATVGERADEDVEEDIYDNIAMPEGKVGTKKLRKLQEKAEKHAMPEQMEREREEKKEQAAVLEEKRKKEEEKQKQLEAAREEEERKIKEEQERREYEEYLKLKEEFTIDEEGEEQQIDLNSESLLEQFINYIKELKVVMLEDLAIHFKIKTQDLPTGARHRQARRRMQIERDSDEETATVGERADEDVEEDIYDNIAMPEGKVGTKKLRKLQEKAEKHAMPEQMEREREERKEQAAVLEEKRKKEEEKQKQLEAAREEEERKIKEEQERREYEEYLKLKEEFTIDEEGEEQQIDLNSESLLEQFINYIKELKVVMLEDLAIHFKIKTQDLPTGARHRQARRRMQIERDSDEETATVGERADEDVEEDIYDNIAMPEGKVGTKKLRKLQEKAEKRAMREQMEREREERKEQAAVLEEKRKKEEEKQKQLEAAREEEERKIKEEQERREYEEYLKLKEEFTIDEEGEEQQIDLNSESLLEQFINYIKELKVVMLEDLAIHFKIKTQQFLLLSVMGDKDMIDPSPIIGVLPLYSYSFGIVNQYFPGIGIRKKFRNRPNTSVNTIWDAIDRINTLLSEGKLSGVMDDRGKFIYITREELEAVAKYIRQRGRISVSDLAKSSNVLINLNPDNELAQRRLLAEVST